MYDIYNLLGINKNSSLRIYNHEASILEIHATMLEEDYSQIVYIKDNNYHLMTELSILPIIDEYARKASNGQAMDKPVLREAYRFDDEMIEVITYENSPEDCIKKIRTAINQNQNKYASILVKISNQFYYFNYSDLEFLNSITRA
jgi:hypothetical protein